MRRCQHLRPHRHTQPHSPSSLRCGQSSPARTPHPILTPCGCLPSSSSSTGQSAFVRGTCSAIPAPHTTTRPLSQAHRMAAPKASGIVPLSAHKGPKVRNGSEPEPGGRPRRPPEPADDTRSLATVRQRAARQLPSAQIAQPWPCTRHSVISNLGRLCVASASGCIGCSDEGGLTTHGIFL